MNSLTNRDMEWVPKLRGQFEEVVSNHLPTTTDLISILPSEALIITSVASLLIGSAIYGLDDVSVVKQALSVLRKLAINVEGADLVLRDICDVERVRVPTGFGKRRDQANEAQLAIDTIRVYLFRLENEIHKLELRAAAEQTPRNLSIAFRRNLANANLTRFINGRRELEPLTDLGIDFTPGLPG